VIRAAVPACAAALVCAAGSAALAACAGLSGGPGPLPPAPAPAWTEAHLPTGGASALIGDLRRCGPRWYAAGGLLDATGATVPALWTSDDARTWRAVPTEALSYYGRQQVLFSLACRDGGDDGDGAGEPGPDLVALGSKNGGQHGVPRISSWRGTGDGPLTEVPGPSELYGGPRAMTVAAVAAGPTGWLVAGDRVGPTGRATAAVWRSPDASAFVEDAAAPGLASTALGDTTARGVISDHSAWLVFGDVGSPDPLIREAAVWSSTDGRTWTRGGPPREPADTSITALATAGAGGRLLAMGTLALAPHAWFYDGSTWSDAGGFEGDEGPGTGVPRVGALTVRAGQAYAAVDGGSRWALWHSPDLHRWQPVPTPAQPASGADDRLLVAASPDLLVLAATTGPGSRLWVAPRG